MYGTLVLSLSHLFDLVTIIGIFLPDFSDPIIMLVQFGSLVDSITIGIFFCVCCTI